MKNPRCYEDISF